MQCRQHRNTVAHTRDAMTNNTKTHLHSAEMQCRWCRNTFANLVAQCWTPLSELLLESEDCTQELEPENTEWVSQFLAGCIVWDYWCIFTLGLGSFFRLLVYHTGAQWWKSFRIAACKWKIHTKTWTWEQTITPTIFGNIGFIFSSYCCPLAWQNKNKANLKYLQLGWGIKG